MSGVEMDKKAEKEEEKGGEVLFCGATRWDMVGRKKGGQEGNLVSPTRLRPLLGVNIRFVASGCLSCHCVALDVEGRCYTWGRNEKWQLGHGDTILRDRPTIVQELLKHKIIRAGAGRSHTVVVTDDGQSLAFGWNKHGQLGSGSVKSEIEPSPVRCLVSDVKSATCGADFTVWLSSVEGSTILTAGLPQYGQLGHGTDNEYNTKDSSVRLAYEAQPRPRAITSLAGETIVKVACGSNHTVAVDSNGYVYTWGFGGYGRLGHREQKDEWAPRRVDVFQRHNVLPPDAVVSAGAVNSACTAAGGQLYMWGKIKNTGDDWMYPKPLMDLSGWNLRCMDSGNMHHFVGADSSCISWGHALYGELGYGPNGQKSSAVPKKVDILEGMHVIGYFAILKFGPFPVVFSCEHFIFDESLLPGETLEKELGSFASSCYFQREETLRAHEHIIDTGVACGMGHSMIIVDRTNIADRLGQLELHDVKVTAEVSEEPKIEKAVAKQSSKRNAAKAPDNSKKRKKQKDSTESEDDDADTDVESDDGEEPPNGVTVQKGKQRGGGKTASAASSGGKGTGRGRGRPPSANKRPDANPVKTGKRGRPRKS